MSARSPSDDDLRDRLPPPSPPPGPHAGGPRRVLAALTLVALGLLALRPADEQSPPTWLAGWSYCIPPPSDRTTAFRSTVVYNLGHAGADPRWNCRTAIPTLATFDPIRAFAARRGLSIHAWLFNDRALGPLEACQGRWRPAIAALAFDPRAPGGVPSIAASNDAFRAHVGILSLVQRTRSKYVTHRLSILTLTIWKGCLANLLSMSNDFVRAYLWDSLAFEASVSVLKHAADDPRPCTAALLALVLGLGCSSRLLSPSPCTWLRASRAMLCNDPPSTTALVPPHCWRSSSGWAARVDHCRRFSPHGVGFSPSPPTTPVSTAAAVAVSSHVVAGFAMLDRAPPTTPAPVPQHCWRSSSGWAA